MTNSILVIILSFTGVITVISCRLAFLGLVISGITWVVCFLINYDLNQTIFWDFVFWDSVVLIFCLFYSVISLTLTNKFIKS